jgi:hypothetical protein
MEQHSHPQHAERSHNHPIVIVTDRGGYIVERLDQRAGSLLNVSHRVSVGKSILPFIAVGRAQLVIDLRVVSRGGQVPQRTVTLRPKERRPQEASISLSETDGGIQWRIELREE